jgi:hypothetical protein
LTHEFLDLPPDVNSSGLHVASVASTNILEDDHNAKELDVQRVPSINDDGDDYLVEVKFRGFEIKTLKIMLGEGKQKTMGVEEWVRIEKR